MEGRKIGGQPIDDARPLPSFHPFPRLTRAIAVQMRMPAFHLREERLGDIVEIEGAALLGDDRVEQELKQ